MQGRQAPFPYAGTGLVPGSLCGMCPAPWLCALSLRPYASPPPSRGPRARRRSRLQALLAAGCGPGSGDISSPSSPGQLLLLDRMCLLGSSTAVLGGAGPAGAFLADGLALLRQARAEGHQVCVCGGGGRGWARQKLCMKAGGWG